MNNRILEQIKPETLIEAKVKKLKLSHFGHVMRIQCSLKKAMMWGKMKGNRKRGIPNVKWIDSINKP